MALFDAQWFTGFQTAATAVGTLLVGVGGTFLVLRRKYSDDSAGIAENRGRKDWTDQLIEFGRPEDARAIGRLEAMLEAYTKRLAELEKDQERQYGECRERVRSLSERVLNFELANGRLQQELALHDKDAAERLLVLQVRPGQPGKGDEPP